MGIRTVDCAFSGQNAGAEHLEGGGEADEGPAVQHDGQHALLGEEEAGAAESHKGAAGRDGGVQRNAQAAAQAQRAGETENQVKNAGCCCLCCVLQYACLYQLPDNKRRL